MVEFEHTASRTIEAVQNARENAQSNFHSLGVSMSLAYNMQARDCPRYFWMMLRWPTPPERHSAKILRIFERGNLEEPRVVEDLRRAGVVVDEVDQTTGRQYRVNLANGWLRGKADGIIRSGLPEAPAAEHILEIKTAKAADWRKIEKQSVSAGKPEHWAQAQLYMHGLGIERALYVCVNKDDDAIYAERIRYNEKACLDIVAQVLEAVNETAPRPALEPESFTCKFCNFKEVCHERKPAEPNCRTCLHSTLTRDGRADCALFDKPLSIDAQKDGCPSHLYNPAFVDGEIIDTDETDNTVTYKLSNGETWVDGGFHG